MSRHFSAQAEPGLDRRQLQNHIANVAQTFAHDLKQPMRAVNNLVGMLRHQDSRMTAERRERILELIFEASERSIRMIDELREYALMTAGGDNVTCIPVRAVTDGIASMLKERPHATVAIEEDVDETVDSWEVSASLRRVVVNLVDNSLKYRRDDETPTDIRVNLQQRGSHLIVRVEDNGMGFEPDNAERIFLPFKQLHGHKEKAEGGCGMGLAICREVVTRHGGDIQASSPGPSQGAKFEFWVPLHAKDHEGPHG